MNAVMQRIAYFSFGFVTVATVGAALVAFFG